MKEPYQSHYVLGLQNQITALKDENMQLRQELAKYKDQETRARKAGFITFDELMNTPPFVLAEQLCERAKDGFAKEVD